MAEKSTNYIDGFVLPIPREYLSDYQQVAKTVAEIWKEHGALAYHEFVSEDIHLEGTRAFADFAGATADEAVVFGWVEFASREARDLANERVANDPRMPDLIGPLTNANRLVFDASRMVYGAFRPLV